MSLFRPRRATKCPYCFHQIELDSCPTIAQNYSSLGGATAGGSLAGEMLGSMPSMIADAYAEAVTVPAAAGAGVEEGPVRSKRRLPTEARATSRPASGAATVGQIGPYPVLFDPESSSQPQQRISGLFGSEPQAFDPVDRPAKLCRHCEMPLPKNLDKVDVFTIALVGSQYSGKTHYLTAAGYEMLRRQRLRGLGLGNVRPTGSTAMDFHETRFTKVYEQRLAHDRTTAAEGLVAAKKPFAMELTRPDGRTCMVLIHDVPGEWLMDSNRRAEYFQFLNHADGVIFLVDPLAIPAVRQRLGDLVDPGHFIGSRWPQDRLIDELADQLGQRALTVPTSVVITKADMVTRAFGEIPEFGRPEAATSAELERDIRELHVVVRDRVMSWLDEPSIMVASERFPIAVFHMVAPLGTLPEITSDGTGSQVQRIRGEIRSSRIIDPIYRVMSGA